MAAARRSSGLGLTARLSAECSNEDVLKTLGAIEHEAHLHKTGSERRLGADGLLYTKDKYEAKFGQWDEAPLPPTDDRPKWSIREFIGPAMGDAIAEVLTPEMAKDDPQWQVAFIAALGKCGTIEAVKALLQSNGALDRLAGTILEASQDVARNEAATGDEMNAKFASEGAFEMSFGSRADFFNGLEVRIGAPNAQILRTMAREHCEQADSLVQWKTGNYGITTTAKDEWLLVVGEIIDELRDWQDEFPKEEWDKWQTARGELEARDHERPSTWPAETINNANESHRRVNGRSKHFLRELVALNRKLRDVAEKTLLIEEALGLRLYTGPLFEKYNAVNRGGALKGKQHPFMAKRFHELCGAVGHENRFTTTLHVITSGLVKASKLTAAVTVFRGMSGGVLPEQFWKSDDSGVRGGVEFGFMSTTTNRAVAFQYARGGGAGTILEMQTGMIDKGADLAWVSQYPHERELCFPPLTSMEVIGSRVDGAVLVISIRLNLNLTSLTIEEVVSKRRKLVVDMCDNLHTEADREFAGWTQDSLASCKEEIRGRAADSWSHATTQAVDVYNDDEKLLKIISSALKVRQGITHVGSIMQLASGVETAIVNPEDAVQCVQLLQVDSRPCNETMEKGYNMLAALGLGVLKDLHAKDTSIRVGVLTKLATLDSVEDPVLKRVIELGADKGEEEVSAKAREVLKKQMECDLAHYMKALQSGTGHTSVAVRQFAWAKLGERGVDSDEQTCMAAAEELRSSSDVELRIVAANTLGAQCHLAEAHAQLLADMATYKSSIISCHEAREEASTKEAIIKLRLELLRNLGRQSRLASTHAQQFAVVAAALAADRKGEDEQVRAEACRAIGQIGETAQAHAGLLHEILSGHFSVAAQLYDNTSVMKVAACEGLAGILPSHDAVQLLIEMVGPMSQLKQLPEVAIFAIGSLARIEAPAEPRLVVLANVASQQYSLPPYRLAAIEGLKEAGHNSLPQLPRLKSITKRWALSDKGWHGWKDALALLLFVFLVCLSHLVLLPFVCPYYLIGIVLGYRQQALFEFWNGKLAYYTGVDIREVVFSKELQECIGSLEALDPIPQAACFSVVSNSAEPLLALEIEEARGS